MTSRFDLPDGLTREQRRALLQALELYVDRVSARPSPWAMAGRVSATGQAALQTRREVDGAWRRVGALGYARRGTEPVRGRGDAK